MRWRPLDSPKARLLSLALPFGGFVWQRPSYAVVGRDGRVARMPIVDVIRREQHGLLALSVAVVLASRLAAPGRRGRKQR